MTPHCVRTLVVEDDSSWQQILSEILTDMGLLVDVASNLEDALKILKLEPHRLAIVDLSLAGGNHHNLDGLRILEGVRRLDPACQTILLTGFATVELAVSVLTEFGAFTFLRKENFQRSQFRETINQALASAQILEHQQKRSENDAPHIIPNHLEEQKGAENPILVVEDDAGWRSILSEILNDEGYQVQICASYGEALGYLRREKFMLAVIDLSLSGDMALGKNWVGGKLEGYELLAHTKSVNIPTIVVSGIVSIEEIKKAYNDHSIFAYLEKQSFDRNTFSSLVKEAFLSKPGLIEFDFLTERERQVFDLLAKGLTNKEIAETLVITTNTVKRHIKAIFEKLGVHTRSAAAAKAVSP